MEPRAAAAEEMFVLCSTASGAKGCTSDLEGMPNSDWPEEEYKAKNATGHLGRPCGATMWRRHMGGAAHVASLCGVFYRKKAT